MGSGTDDAAGGEKTMFHSHASREVKRDNGRDLFGGCQLHVLWTCGKVVCEERRHWHAKSVDIGGMRAICRRGRAAKQGVDATHCDDFTKIQTKTKQRNTAHAPP
jgi:hypothetical protein